MCLIQHWPDHEFRKPQSATYFGEDSPSIPITCHTSFLSVTWCWGDHSQEIASWFLHHHPPWAQMQSPSHHDFGSMGLCLTPNLNESLSLSHLSTLFHFTLYQIRYIFCSYQFITFSFKWSPDIPLENSSLVASFSSIFLGVRGRTDVLISHCLFQTPDHIFFVKTVSLSVWLASSTLCEHSSVKLSVILSHL